MTPLIFYLWFPSRGNFDSRCKSRHKWIGADPVGEDAQHDGADRGRCDGVAAVKVFVEDDHGKNDTGQPPGAEPSHEEFLIGPKVHAAQ